MTTSARNPRYRQLASLIGCLALACSAARSDAGETIELSEGWQFALASNGQDPAWREVSIPHDWSISLPRSENEPSAGAGGFFQTGKGRYRYDLDAPEDWKNKKIIIAFEGAYRNATLIVNGSEKGTVAYGYTPFAYDITSDLMLGRSNRIEVRIDNSAQPNARWYTGSGIFRPVWLSVVDPIHIKPESISIATQRLSEDRKSSTLDISATAGNESPQPTDITIELTAVDSHGNTVATFSQTGAVEPGKTFSIYPSLEILNPAQWSPESPNLYQLVTRTYAAGQLTDEQQSAFGIRTVETSATDGILLNGEPVALFGGNVHHDNGALGAAAYRDAEYRKARILKEAGFNAVRTAHNLPSTAFLDACDTYGLLVIDEAFDGWKSKKLKRDYGEIFDDNWRGDLEAMIYRDRNHPSVIMWSIGNEVYERGKESGIEIAAAMRERIKAIDPKRAVTAGINGLGKPEDWPKLDRLFSQLDVAGYNYEIDRHGDDHARLPERIVYSSESYLVDAFKSWKTTTENSYVLGDFVWSAIDYLGEAGIGRVFPPDQEAKAHWEGSHYPWHGAACGDIDLNGQRKPVSHYRNIVWDRGEKLYAAVLEPTPSGEPWNLHNWATPPMLASWTWPKTKPGTELTVEVYSRYPRVRLYLNGKIVGEQATSEAEEFKAAFKVPYQAGKLVAVGLEAGVEVERFALETAKATKKIELSAEAPISLGTSNTLRFVHATLTDSKGRWNPSSDTSVSYHVLGPARIIAIGSSQLDSDEAYGANPRKTHKGKALVVIEITGPGPIKLTASADGLKAATLKIK